MSSAGVLLAGRYLIDQLLGQGGFAAVYRATDSALGRSVAIKVLHPNFARDEEFRTLFLSEARTSATLDHPHILGLHDVGTLDERLLIEVPDRYGRPYLQYYSQLCYFVMPHILGGSLADRLDGAPLSPPVALRYLGQIAVALDYAHARGIVHRDLKPQNLLLRAADDHLLLGDFGIARVLSGTRSMTNTSVVGTPHYMAPEQFQGQVSRAADRYAFGCIAYQLFTGTVPFPINDTLALMHAHSTQEVPPATERIAARGGQLPAALDAVLAQALAKRPEDRPASAAAIVDLLAAALRATAPRPDISQAETVPLPTKPPPKTRQRKSATSPIEAAPTELSPKTPPPKPPPPAASEQETVPTPSKPQRRTRSPKTLPPTAVPPPAAPQSDPPAVRASAPSATPVLPIQRPIPPPQSASPPQSAPPPRSTPAAPPPPPRDSGQSVAALPARQRRSALWLGLLGGGVVLVLVLVLVARNLRGAGGTPTVTSGLPTSISAVLEGHSKSVWDVAWSPDGRTLATASDDQTVRLWDIATGRSTATLIGHTEGVNAVAWSPDGRTLASGAADSTVRLWDVTTKVLSNTLSVPGESISAIAWSPDGRTLATGSSAGTVRLWNPATGQSTATLFGHTRQIYSVAWSPDGRTLASASVDTTVRLWDVAAGRTTATLTSHTDNVWDVAWSPDGRTLATASADKTLRLWDPSTGRNTATFQGHTDPVLAVAWSPDGQTLASGSFDDTIRLWNPATGKTLTTIQPRAGELYTVKWSPDGQTLATAGSANAVRLWR